MMKDGGGEGRVYIGLTGQGSTRRSWRRSHSIRFSAEVRNDYKTNSPMGHYTFMHLPCGGGYRDMVDDAKYLLFRPSDGA